MKTIFLLLFCSWLSIQVFSQHTLVANDFKIPDSGRVFTLYTEFLVKENSIKRKQIFIANGFQSGEIQLIRKARKRRVGFALTALPTQQVELFAAGIGIATSIKKQSDGSNIATALWNKTWKENQVYKTMVTALPDSATKSTIYTAYFLEPDLQRWKFLAAYKLTNEAIAFTRFQQTLLGVDPAKTNPWIQTERGKWIAIQSGDFFAKQSSGERPVVDWTKNTDSLQQAQKDYAEIIDAVNAKRIDTTGSKDGVYYKIVKEGKGAFVKLTDTVTVFYKGSLLVDDSIFDQTKDKPAVFPLNRLIKGWQLIVPQCKVGSVVKIFIPSALAYSIRSRSKSIPPNSVLVFEIEVVDTK
ncbi:MAG: DUF3472 domain-containing protein [Sphingobacteriia bacterium]|nr:MAG: DUF3472 domain-containing protein [Sphingobacteriia bacterium]TAH08506.1 MAG: DUF3472 domain-containing protein [Sphingobacteriia bacterium]